MTTTTPDDTTTRSQSTSVTRLAGLLYAVVAYVLFLGSFTAFAAFVHGIALPWRVDLGLPTVGAILVNMALVASFAVQHTIMARAEFKSWWTRIVPAALERSTFVLAASLLMVAIVWLWQPVPGTLWSVAAGPLATALHVICVLGYLGVVASSFLIDHFHLFGLQQVWRNLRGKAPRSPVFHEPWAYRRVRHPMMTSVLVMMWAAPTMTVSQALLAGLFTAYTLAGVLVEERELVGEHGETYQAYRERVPHRVIPGIY